jgi:type VI secretion system protein ImpB
VEIGDAIELKELPFVMGVLGDFPGQPPEPLPQLRDRTFVEVNPDNFDAVLAGMKPHVAFSVADKLTNDPNSKINVNLHFQSMDDFEPDAVARQVPPLKKLLDLRTKLSDLRGNLQGNDLLEKALLQAVGDDQKLNKLKSELSAPQSEEEPNA